MITETKDYKMLTYINCRRKKWFKKFYYKPRMLIIDNYRNFYMCKYEKINGPQLICKINYEDIEIKLDIKSGHLVKIYQKFPNENKKKNKIKMCCFSFISYIDYNNLKKIYESKIIY